MRKLVAFTAVWLAAAAVAVVVAWQGVGIVTSQVTDDRPAPLAAGEVRALTEETQGSGTAAPTPTTTAAPAAGTPPPGETPAPTGSPGNPATPGAAAPTTTPATAPSAPPATTPTTAPPPSPTTTAPAPAETRTYNVVGGSAALRFSASGVTVVWATPAAGFEVEIEPEAGNGVQVDFESEDHRSRVTGWWDGGPRDATREDER